VIAKNDDSTYARGAGVSSIGLADVSLAEVCANVQRAARAARKVLALRRSAYHSARRNRGSQQEAHHQAFAFACAQICVAQKLARNRPEADNGRTVY
jgi:hypothetical protein